MASKKIRRLNSDEGDLKVDMSPMIDMVFLLLIFFIVASTVIVVKQDPEVAPAVAKHSKKPKDGKGRIVINVRNDGSFLDETSKQSFADVNLLTEYILKMKDIEDAKGLKPLIHLRGDKGVTFNYVRTVIRAASRAGVDTVNFSVYGFEKN